MGDFELEAVLQWGPGATWDHSDLQPPPHGKHRTPLQVFSLAQ